ncbi:MAG: hypothetical protein DI539_17900 [Flavobacterium psychrophilum]|nr:MAG: hypothetical protein DI539_17900 [Flavobacterium psychrophilum]
MDSLANKDFKYLFTRIRNTEKELAVQDIYLHAFLKKAKATGDWELIINGYKNYADYANDEIAITYSDSMIITAIRSGSGKLIGSAYLSKGIIFYDQKRHEMALENYLLARPYIVEANDKYLEYKLKYNIAHVKYYLGKNDEAIALFEACRDYFKANNPRAYLNILHSLGLCYSHEGNFGRSKEFVDLGLTESIILDNHTMDVYFLHLDGQNDFFTKNYSLAIQKLLRSIDDLEKLDDYANIAVANFYIGKSYWLVSRYKESIPYLKRVAYAFDKKAYMRPDLRETFELLIDYYKKQEDAKEVLFYVDQLLKADSLLVYRHDKLYDNVHKNYDTSELRQQKQDIERQLTKEHSYRKILIGSSGAFLCTSIWLVVVFRRNRKRQERIFRELMENKKPKSRPARDVPKELGIPQETVDKVLARLDKWEQSMRYLEPNITRASMAVYLETNVHYVSDVILHYKGKSFTQYVNDLKVDYIIEQLKTDKNKRLFTHDALSKEAGFGTTQSFVIAFKARTTLSPNYFSAKIKKEMAENNL